MHYEMLVTVLFELQRPVSRERLQHLRSRSRSTVQAQRRANQADIFAAVLQRVHDDALTLYGPRFFTLKWHLLLHLCDFDERFGPLNQQHCFGYEVRTRAGLCWNAR
jgi:hypothetical protein